MSNYIIFKCNYKYYDYIVKKIVQYKIDVVNSKYQNNEYYFKVTDKSYETLVNIDYKKIIIFVRGSGINYIKDYIKKNIQFILITLSIIIITFLSNLIIIKVNIHTNNINLKSSISYLLMDFNVKDYSLKQSYKRIQIIKKNILDKYSNEIEWIEIKPNGYTYDVYLIERKIKKNHLNNKKCNYIAKKSGTITSIKVNKGVVMVQENNYVNQGDILISGDVIYNDELKKTVCASGKIYGEVWYEVEVTYPLEKITFSEKKKKQYNISFNIFNKTYKIFKDKYSSSKIAKKIGSNDLGIVIYKSYKKNKIVKKESINEGIKKSLEKARENILLKSHNKSKILSQNILKKYVNNGTIYMKVLITTEEEIGVVESY